MQDLKTQVISWKRGLVHVAWLTHHWELYSIPACQEELKREMTEYTENMVMYYSRALECYHKFCACVCGNPLRARYGAAFEKIPAQEGGGTDKGAAVEKDAVIDAVNIAGAMVEIEGEYFPIGFLEEMKVGKDIIEARFEEWKTQLAKEYVPLAQDSRTWETKEKETLEARRKSPAASRGKGVFCLFLFLLSAPLLSGFWLQVKDGARPSVPVILLVAAATLLSLNGIFRAVHELYLFYKGKQLTAQITEVNSLNKLLSERRKELQGLSYSEFCSKASLFPKEYFPAVVAGKRQIYTNMIYLYKGRTRVITGKGDVVLGLLVLVAAMVLTGV